MKNNIAERVNSINIDIDNMVEDLRQERDMWKDRWNEVDKIRLNELIVISKKLNRIYKRLKK
jgi:hypothetical protein